MKVENRILRQERNRKTRREKERDTHEDNENIYFSSRLTEEREREKETKLRTKYCIFHFKAEKLAGRNKEI